MYVHLTFAKLDPSRLEAARTFYTSAEVSGVIRKQAGYRFHYLLESVATPWDTPLRPYATQHLIPAAAAPLRFMAAAEFDRSAAGCSLTTRHPQDLHAPVAAMRPRE